MSFIDLAVQGADASAPASGFLRLYVKSAGLFLIDSSGVVIGPLYGEPVNIIAATELTIAAGVVVQTGSHHTIDNESDAASDILHTITPATNPAGNFLIIRPEDGARTVIVEHNTGNIVLNGGADITLDDITDHLLLFYDGTQWNDLL